MALGSTHPLTEMSTRSISGGKGGQCVGLRILPPSCADFLEIWEPPGKLRACPDLYRDCFTFFYLPHLEAASVDAPYRVAQTWTQLINNDDFTNECCNPSTQHIFRRIRLHVSAESYQPSSGLITIIKRGYILQLYFRFQTSIFTS